MEKLYRAIVELGRDPFWYREGAVPDTLDGRFDMMAAVTALVLLRMESAGLPAREPSVRLTEIFVDDMDASLRQIGIGEYVVGKHVGRMMGALGGRLTAFRNGRAGNGLEAAVRRNIFHDSPPSETQLRLVTERLEHFADRLDAQPIETLLAGKLERP